MLGERSEGGLREYLEKIDGLADELEKKLECKVVLLVFHYEVSITRDVVDDLEFYIGDRVGEYRDKDVCVVVHTLGGDPDAAYHIGRRLQDIVGENSKLIFVVPRIAKSAGTLLVCSGDEIYMTPITELGPVDPQIEIKETGNWVSAKVVRDSLRQVLEVMKELGISNTNTIEVALRRVPIVELGHYNSLISHVSELVTNLLSRRMFKDEKNKAGEIASKLAGGFNYHGRVIDYSEAKDMGLKVKLLEGERLSAVRELYKAIRELFDVVDRTVQPLLVPLREMGIFLSSPRSHVLKHGLIYLPEAEKPELEA